MCVNQRQDSRRTGKGNDFGAERSDPRDAQLPGRTTLPRCNDREFLDKLEVVLNVLVAEPRQVTTEVILGQVVDTLD